MFQWLATHRALFVLDAALCAVIIAVVPFTEIDWTAYMQEVEGFLAGDLVYTNLRGDTGPLVYPAAFVYIYSAFYYLTGLGKNIFTAQLLFAGIYLLVLAIVLRIYNACAVPFKYAFALILSKRVHSLFLLRCFNDGVAMLLLYIAVAWIMERKFSRGCVFFSLAVGCKMNILLFAPGLLCVLMAHLHPVDVLRKLVLCAGVQVAIAAPFLATDARAYVGRAFEIGRVFTFKWTVNMKFLPEEVFVSKGFGHALLLATLLAWALVWRRRWAIRWRAKNTAALTHRRDIVLTLFESNIIGFCLCRSMHYQFYLWAFHQVPFILALSFDRRLPLGLQVMVFSTMEWAFNTYPSTPSSSFMLVGCALLPLLIGVVFCRDDDVTVRRRDEIMVPARLQAWRHWRAAKVAPPTTADNDHDGHGHRHTSDDHGHSHSHGAGCCH